MAGFCEHGYEVRSSVKKALKYFYRHLMFSRGSAFGVIELPKDRMLYKILNLMFSRRWEPICKICDFRHWMIRNILKTRNSLNGSLYFNMLLSHSSVVNMINTRAKYLCLHWVYIYSIYIYIYIYIYNFPYLINDKGIVWKKEGILSDKLND